VTAAICAAGRSQAKLPGSLFGSKQVVTACDRRAAAGCCLVLAVNRSPWIPSGNREPGFGMTGTPVPNRSVQTGESWVRPVTTMYMVWCC